MSTPTKFFETVERESSDNLCTWVGELYLELHQGTFSTQAMVKFDTECACPPKPSALRL